MNSIYRRPGAIALISALGVLVNVSVSTAQGLGGLTVSPTRIVFEGRHRSAEVTIVNSSSIPSTYRISFKNMRMLEDGSYEDIKEAQQGELFADKMIRFAPRQVTLEPGAPQIVRLLLRKPANLSTGEYRSHLLFQGIPPETSGEDIEKLDLKEDELQIQIKTVLAVTIPVTVRHGELSAKVAFADLSLIPPETPDSLTILSFRLNRSGNKTVSGEVEVTFESNQGEENTVVGLVRGIAVLNPYLTRTVKLPIRVPEGVIMQNGQLHIVYRSRPEEGSDILAETYHQIP